MGSWERRSSYVLILFKIFIYLGLVFQNPVSEYPRTSLVCFMDHMQYLVEGPKLMGVWTNERALFFWLFESDMQLQRLKIMLLK